MKTQFTSLVKIKKERLEMMQRSVQSCHETISRIEQKIEASYHDLRQIQAPQQGDFSIFRQIQLLKHRAQDEIRFNKHNLALAQNALFKAMQQLKTANIEYEKFKYLETTEVEKILKERRLKEAKALDEAALIGFSQKTVSVRK